MFLKNLINKYKSVILYLVFGVCTTLVNIISYYVFSHIFKAGVMSSTIIAWVLAVLFAYLTNRKWVFKSNAKTKGEILKEIISFFLCRLATGVIDWVIMFIFVKQIGFNDMIVKVIANIIVIVLNYVASKLIIFKGETNKNSKFKISETDLIIYGSFLVVSFVFLLTSSLHIWKTTDSFIDSSVFKTVALMMKNGFMPYVDTFDHKGPLIYIYNYIGEIITPYKGLFYIEFVSMFVTICYFFKTARLKCNRVVSYIITLLPLTLLFNYFQGGNFTEEFALPFIAYSLYVFLDYLLNNKLNKTRIILCGFGMGAVLMLRPNMISIWIVFCLYFLVDCIRNKKIKYLIESILFFLLGALIVILPIMIWLIAKGAFSDFIYQYLVFNKMYTTASAPSKSIMYKDILETIFTFLKDPIIIASFLVCAYSVKFNKKNIVYFAYMVITFLLMCLSGRTYEHYAIIFVPVIIYPFTIIYDYCKKIDSEKNHYIVSLVLSIYLLSVVILPPWIDLVKELPGDYLTRNDNKISSEMTEVSKIIKEKTDKNDRISIYGNYNIIYILSNRLPATKYSYQFPIGDVLPDILDEYYEQLEKEKPKIIVIQNDGQKERMQKYLQDNNYELIPELENIYKVYELKKD